MAKTVATHCPECGRKCSTPINLVGNEWGIDDAKCSSCFQDRNIFVNLVRDIPEPILETDVRQTQRK